MGFWNEVEAHGVEAGNVPDANKILIEKGEYPAVIENCYEGVVKVEEVEQPCIKVEWRLFDERYNAIIVRQNLKINEDKENVRKRALTLFCNIDANAGNVLSNERLEPTDENLCKLVGSQMTIGIEHVEKDGKVENHFVSKILLNQ
jgi:hypothetical protein